MLITFLGHAGFLLESDGITVAIDPFLTDNPVARHRPSDIRADFILATHGHGDHLGDSIEMAKNSGGTIISVVEVARYCKARGVKSHGLNFGGGVFLSPGEEPGTVKEGPLHVRLVPAWHTSSTGTPAEYLGVAGGFIITLAGKTVYHAGDTCLFGDMALYGRLYPIDIALLPIGDNYTMDPVQAIEAVGLLKPKKVIPMHYNTWPIIEQDPNLFKAEVEKRFGVAVEILLPGEEIEI